MIGLGQRWVLGCGVLILSMAPAGAQIQSSPLGAGAAVSWSQLAPDCRVAAPASADVRVIACGASGSFVFSPPDAPYQGDCVPIAGGTATPALFPTEPVPSLPPAFPCAGGSCFGHTPGRPWVAVLDWPTEHGWSVAATIQEASDRRLGVELFDLTSAGTRLPGAPVSDLAVLIELCAVAELPKEDRPLAVNLSFGRRRTAGSASDLSGPIGHVLQDLAAHGTLAVAAAGNDGELLFPAASPGVISSGALDLSYLQGTQGIRPSTQTPPSATALMLGYGLYLPAGDGETYWPAPPGSSFAAAVLTGWLGGTLAAGGKLPDPATGSAGPGAPLVWTPAFTAEGLALAYGGVPLSGSRLNGPSRLLERARGKATAAPEPSEGVTLALAGLAPPLPPDSMLHADAGNEPQPGVDLCVPCRGNGGSGGFLDSPETLGLDLSASGVLPAQMELVAVFLRVGKAVYGFEGSRDPAMLAAIAAGDLGRITLSGVGGILSAGGQPSLVLVVNVLGTAYWHEVPIHLPG